MTLMTASPSHDETDRLGFLLHDAARLMRRRFEKRASSFGLSSAQWRLLVRVFKDEGVTQARLAELLEIEPISVSRLVDRMVEGGWIERRFDEKDRRVRQIFLTDRSRPIFGDMRAVAMDVFELALGGLSAEERHITINGLKTICANLTDCETNVSSEERPAARSNPDKAA
ncbi:MarR family winged helix-turn-helix transcriptional regulator [Arvimicrobium flavum]|uniref:MarR family winged helix-turn-helix transcriptional regulator n=1 Tax=Arvimicrobium flavum TaxID=3393320 RepID=UPI00237ADF4A|nr:MarR family transcriptional regulator [Mesorhizobium shangrilense]